MSVRRRSLLALLLLCSLVLPPAASAGAGDEFLVRIWIQDAGTELTGLQSSSVTPLAYELLPRPYVLARVDVAARTWLAQRSLSVEVLDRPGPATHYCMTDAAGPEHARPTMGTVVAADSYRIVLRLDGPDANCTGMSWPLDRTISLAPIARSGPSETTVVPLPIVEDIMAQVDLARMMNYIKDLSGEQRALVNGAPYTILSRHTNSGQPIQMAVDYMIERLQRLGLNVSTHTWTAGRPPNIIAEKPGRSTPEQIYIICGHLDSYASVSRAPGADDNASGSVAVLTAAEILAPYTFGATLRFILFTGEEQGLYGSQAYALMTSSEDIRGVLNLDMIAWDNQGGPDMDLHASSSVPGSMTLAGLFADVVSAYELNLTPVIYSNGTGASDHAPFWTYGVSAILAIENYRSDGPIPSDFNLYYHSLQDLSTQFNQPFFHEMTQASLATVAHMAGPWTDCHWADLNCDCQVDITDLAAGADHWGSTSGQWDYHYLYDLNRDGAVSIADVQRLASEWGWICGP